MPRADFYLIAKPRFLNEPLRLVCELARKANDANLSTLILARDAEQAEALDDLLWAFDDEAYVPHQIAGTDEEDELAPVLIAAPEFAAPLAPAGDQPARRPVPGRLRPRAGSRARRPGRPRTAARALETVQGPGPGTDQVRHVNGAGIGELGLGIRHSGLARIHRLQPTTHPKSPPSVPPHHRCH